MRITLNDIATKVGVTKTTVSMALRNSPGVSQTMRDLIRRVAADMGYVVDPILQRLATYRRGGPAPEFQSVIAWLNHWREPEQVRRFHEFDQYWRGANLAAKRLGYRLEEFIWPPDCAAKEAEQKLLERGVLGLLIPPHKPEVSWGDFDWSKFSLVRFGLSVVQVDSNLVTSDHQRAMVMAIEKIHDYGYRRIGLIYDAAHDRSMGGNIYGGFLWACEMLKLEERLSPLDFNVQGLADSGKKDLKLWMNKHKPDAILTTAPQTPIFLRELGYRIPDDIALASTSAHDTSISAGIDQRPGAIGQIAAEVLIKQISLNERGEPADPCRILVESQWQDGKSLPVAAVAAPPAIVRRGRRA
jgi:DNA-binding LacI/PurR family transcriptional regulator